MPAPCSEIVTDHWPTWEQALAAVRCRLILMQELHKTQRGSAMGCKAYPALESLHIRHTCLIETVEHWETSQVLLPQGENRPTSGNLGYKRKRFLYIAEKLF